MKEPIDQNTNPINSNTVSQPEDQTASSLTQNKKALFIGGIILVIVVIIFSSVFLKPNYKSQESSVSQLTVTPTNIIPSAKPTLPRSKTPGIITQVMTAKSINPTTGEVVNPTVDFVSTDKNIFLVLSLKNPKVGSKFEYVRYLNNVYLDKGSLAVTKPSTNNLSFVWTLKKVGATHQAGQYRIKVYSNGIFEKEISFTVR